MKELGQLSFTILSTIVTAIFAGFVLMTLWDWFIVYSFGVKSLSLVEAIGVGLFLNFFKRLPSPKENVTFESVVKDTFEKIFVLALLLGVSFIVTLFQ